MVYKLFIYYCTGNFWKGLKGCCIWNPYYMFSSSFSVTVMTSSKDASVIACTCAFINPLTVVSGHIWRRVWHHRSLDLVTPLQCCQISLYTPVWFHTIASLIIYLGQCSCHPRVHIGLWTCARSQETLQVLPLILLGNPSSVLCYLPSKQCYIDMLAWCRCLYMEYRQLWSNIYGLIAMLSLTSWCQWMALVQQALQISLRM